MVCDFRRSLLFSHVNRILGFDRPLQARGVSRDYRICWDVFGDHPAGADNCILANRHATKNRYSRANRIAFFDERLFDLPVFFGLQLALHPSSARLGIVNESYTMTDEDVVFYRDSFTDKRVA